MRYSMALRSVISIDDISIVACLYVVTVEGYYVIEFPLNIHTMNWKIFKIRLTGFIGKERRRFADRNISAS